jgi:hypothetical protein
MPGPGARDSTKTGPIAAIACFGQNLCSFIKTRKDLSKILHESFKLRFDVGRVEGVEGGTAHGIEVLSRWRYTLGLEGGYVDHIDTSTTTHG